MKTFLKIILIILIVFAAIFLLARFAVSFTKLEPREHTFTVKKSSLNIIKATIKKIPSPTNCI